jgi:ABC transporter substrate binding protein (PQQ-dependent alcohol dehydrogenase system)
MLADGLAQYLVWKQWRAGSWCAAPGATMRRSPTPCGAQPSGSVARSWRSARSVETGSRRSDGGHEQIQLQIPAFTQNAPAYDVLLVADERSRSAITSRIARGMRGRGGNAGTVPMSWHPALEQWGATQFQNRFRRLANRPMRPLDYDVWVAVRSVGEAATRTRSAEPRALIPYMRSAEFDLAAFKGAS